MGAQPGEAHCGISNERTYVIPDGAPWAVEVFLVPEFYKAMNGSGSMRGSGLGMVVDKPRECFFFLGFGPYPYPTTTLL